MAKKALCIGINNYPGTDMDLQGCVNDATDWAGVLGERGFKVASLLDDQATKAAMLKSMGELIGKAGKGDTLVITFSATAPTSRTPTATRSTASTRRSAPTICKRMGEALTDDEIRNLSDAQGRRAHRADFRLCHSGTVTRAAKAEKDADSRPRFMPMGNWLPDKLPPKNRQRQGGRHDERPGRHLAAGCRLFEQAGRPAAPAARKAPTTSVTTPGSRGASTAPSPTTRGRHSRARRGATYAEVA